jgi:hypothetical protein
MKRDLKGSIFTFKLKVFLPAYSIIQLATIIEKTAKVDESKHFGNKISGIFSKIVYRIWKENITIEIINRIFIVGGTNL